MTRGKKARPIRDRIVDMVTVDPRTDCWIWQGTSDPKGYGRITVGSRTTGSQRSRRVHRVAYEAWIGPIPDGLTIDHLCGTTSCCNPDHLEPVTRAENVSRARSGWKRCGRGHMRNAANTYRNRNGSHQCRVCKRERAAERRKIGVR